MMLNDYVIGAALLGQMDTVSVGIMGLVCLLVLVFAIMSAKTWHWVNIVFLLLTLIAGVAAAFGMTQIYNQRTSDLREYQQALERMTRAEAALEEATVGDPLSPTHAPGTLRHVNQELSTLMVGRGRVWNGSIAANGDLRTFTFADPRDVSNEREQLKDYILYGFQDREVRGQSHPMRYVGTFRVNDETNESVTLEPVQLADINAFDNASGSWTLFEKMPIDRHGVFRNAIITEAQTNPEAAELYKTFADSMRQENESELAEVRDITAFRTILKSDYLPAEPLGYDPQSPEYESLIDHYSFDGLPVGQIAKWIDANSDSRVTPRFEPVPEETFYKFKFNSPSTGSYAVDTSGSLENDGIFSPSGQVVVPQFQHSGDIQFDKDDIVLIDSLTAEGYQRSADSVAAPFTATEDVQQIDTIFVRQLRDFPYEFSEMRNQAKSIIDETNRITQAGLLQDKALEDALKQITAREQEKANLLADQEKLEQDLAKISQVRNAKEALLAEKQQQAQQLQIQLDELYMKLREITTELAKRAFTIPLP